MDISPRTKSLCCLKEGSKSILLFGGNTGTVFAVTDGRQTVLHRASKNLTVVDRVVAGGGGVGQGGLAYRDAEIHAGL